ncbi:hypothetical protein DSC91_000753 [Paraburkholderia caffeinilytica]|uniref:Lipocalin-like domain-containing protein n=1 Tax=Paraburkholderia caffeinilytica TaxID=1761016 RepID=A0ABQ1N7B1_9BURK|nr:hypothetical protein [Paraburkholderia caffeinilytica]AXL49075.1 hypothetical protein DSC91_000753 [Paraburkholderia caffeinilytica]GGC56660.1 hypothetical protein GCM10011400_50430 [Paraburkholderia caffeinilytica]CAB3807161.1 hypothetical protein LMG28690_06736 [Paraburkholderia caffeinilytica]
MYDAEIAATLLNRWTARSSTTDFDVYLELLREGNLSFTYQSGHVRDAGIEEAGAFNIESLVFGDGSRALRVEAPDQTPRWTRWVAVEPLLPVTSEA